MAKLYNRNQFDVLKPPSDGDSDSGGSSMNGVQPYPPQSLKNSGNTKTTPKQYAPVDGSTEKSDKSSGRGDGDDNRELKTKPRGSTPASSISKPISGGNIGGMISPSDSQKLQEEAGVSVDLPTEKDINDIIEKAWRNIDKLNPTSSRNTIGGSGSGNLRKKIAELHTPKVDWRFELKRFIGKALSGSEDFMGARRHIHAGTYITGERNKFDGLDSAVVAIDVSGSVIGDFPEFITEVVEISKARQIARIHVAPFSDRVKDVVVLKRKEAITPETFANVRLGGGTEAIGDVIKYVKENAKNNPAFVVIITDGYLTSGLPKAPIWGKKTIWVIFDSDPKRRRANLEFNPGPQWGKVIYVSYSGKGTW